MHRAQPINKLPWQPASRFMGWVIVVLEHVAALPITTKRVRHNASAQNQLGLMNLFTQILLGILMLEKIMGVLD
jgi:hypothetical protein